MYYKASTPSGKGIATAFLADEVGVNQIVLSARNKETGSVIKVGTYISIEEAAKVATEMVEEKGYEFV